MADRIAPATPAHFEQIADHMARWKKSKGYPPNTWYTMARKPAVFRAYRDLLISVLLWPFFLHPAANGNPPLFRLRSFVRYTLNLMRGEVKQ